MKNIYLMIQAVRAEIAAIPALTDGDKGDITVSGSGATWTIDNTVVSNAKLANVATSTFKGRIASGSGSPEDLTSAQATSMLDTFSSSLKGLAPASGGGTSNFLRADGTWAAAGGSGTVTSVAALTLGTSGTDLSSTVANGTTTPVITLNVPNASATNRGALSSADWTTFNNKQNALGFTAENVANKASNLNSPDNTKYPTTLAVSTQFSDSRSILGTERTGNIWHTQAITAAAPSTGAFAQTIVFLSLDVFEIDTIINAVAVEIVTTAGAAGSLLRIGLYKIATEDFTSATLVGDSGTIAADVTGFRQWTPGSPLSLTPGRYLWALSHNSGTNITFRNVPAAGCRPLGSSSTISTGHNITIQGARAAFGAMPSNISSLTSLTYATAAPMLVNYRIT